MKRSLVVVPIVITTILAYSLYASQPPSAAPVPEPSVARQGAPAKAIRGEMAIWSSYVGKVEPRSPVTVMSKARTNATLVELVPEATKVEKGDVLARLNSSAAEREVVKAQKDSALAESELNAFGNAKAPLELQELTIKLMEARSAHEAERAYLNAMIGLGNDGLISPPELQRQKDKVAELKTQLEKAELQLRLTREHLHPAEIKRAQARVSAADADLRSATQEVQESVIRAPVSGVVIYSHLYVGPELRTVRVGDNISANQPFMLIYDVKDLIVQCEIPEAELQKVEIGKDVAIQPLAFPDLRLKGSVTRISPVVASVPGRPAWQKMFLAFIRLSDDDARLKPGMSVTAHVLSSYKRDALLVPRSAVSWQGGRPVIAVVSGAVIGPRVVRIGMASETSYEIVEGLREGDVVAVQ